MAEDPPPDLADPLPLSALQHAVFCLRQAALIHIERLWAENRFTAEGRVLHEAAHDPSRRTRGAVRRVTALPLSCRRLHLAGVADLVEFIAGPAGETAYPVEYKRGKAKLHRADEVQLCAQALCLEEMTGRPVPEGALYYGETRRRVPVPFDAELRRLTEATALSLVALIAAGRTPAAEYKASRCRACSLHRERPGRPSLALDLMEELRPILADRLALSLINRRQVRARDFEVKDGGAVLLTDDGRRTVLTAWQERKRETRRHPFLEEEAPLGLVPHLQALLLARHLRGDLDAYPPWIWK